MFRSFRLAWTFIAAVILSPLISEYFVELAKDWGLYKHPTEQVQTAMSWLSALASNPSYRLAAAFIVGLAVGSWLEILLRRYTNWSAARARKAKGEDGPVDHSREIHNVYVHGKRILISELFDQSAVIQARTYDRCVFMGPAMVTFTSCNVSLAHMNVDETHGIESIIYEIPEGKFLVGPVMFQRCTFADCEFQKVGFMFNKDAADEFRRGYYETLARQDNKFIPR
jgi:hypothetical protein